MCTPLISLADPVTHAEGSIDPLGVATLADRLADAILPGMTARMWRPRFLTAIAVASVVTEPFQQWADDGVTPPYVVFEWYMVEAFARADTDRSEGLRRIPGIDKARAAQRDGVPMSARGYLKTATVFGFHGVYKTLARALGVADTELLLGENGYRLARTSERERDLAGFTDGESGTGATLRKQLREVVSEGLRKGHTVENRRWRFFPDHLRPDAPGTMERRLLWELLLSDGVTRKEVFQLMTRRAVRADYTANATSSTEAALIGRMQERASAELRYRLNAVDAYEGVCRILQDGFDWLRNLCTHAGAKAVSAADVARQAAPLAARLPAAIQHAREALDGTGLEAQFEELAVAFDGVNDATSFFYALLTRHETVQRHKPPDGKRPWFERTDDGGVVIRPLYRLDSRLPEDTHYVHGYRMASVASFIDDLGGGR